MKNQVDYEVIKNDVIVLKNLIDIKSGLINMGKHMNMINEIDRSISILINTILPLLTSINESNEHLNELIDLYDDKFISINLENNEIADKWVD